MSSTYGLLINQQSDCTATEPGCVCVRACVRVFQLFVWCGYFVVCVCACVFQLFVWCGYFVCVCERERDSRLENLIIKVKDFGPNSQSLETQINTILQTDIISTKKQLINAVEQSSYKTDNHRIITTSLIAQSTAQSTAPAAQRHDRMSTG